MKKHTISWIIPFVNMDLYHKALAEENVSAEMMELFMSGEADHEYRTCNNTKKFYHHESPSFVCVEKH